MTGEFSGPGNLSVLMGVGSIPRGGRIPLCDTQAVDIIYPEVVTQECSKTPKTGTENYKMLGTGTPGEVGA